MRYVCPWGTLAVGTFLLMQFCSGRRAVNDSSHGFFSSCRRVCCWSAHHGWTGVLVNGVPRQSAVTVSAFSMVGTPAFVASGPCLFSFEGPSLGLHSLGQLGLSESILWNI